MSRTNFSLITLTQGDDMKQPNNNPKHPPSHVVNPWAEDSDQSNPETESALPATHQSEAERREAMNQLMPLSAPIVSQPTEDGSLQSELLPPDKVAVREKSNRLERSLSFFSPSALTRALEIADYDVQEEITHLVNIIREPEATNRDRREAMKQIREVVEQAARLGGLIGESQSERVVKTGDSQTTERVVRTTLSQDALDELDALDEMNTAIDEIPTQLERSYVDETEESVSDIHGGITRAPEDAREFDPTRTTLDEPESLSGAGNDSQTPSSGEQDYAGLDDIGIGEDFDAGEPPGESPVDA
jgi:vacuolar-type H+-ATPase subunit I/STV1